ncbi:metalloregulator ArsR/SmtB family transcription factor [soil metagenome]
MHIEDSLSQTFAALADPTRRAMLAQLKHGECSVTDLARPYEMSLPAITKHIKILERAGLVIKTKDAQWRPCKLKQDGLKEVADWMEEYRVYWQESFDRLEAYLQTVTEKDRKENKKHGRKK